VIAAKQCRPRKNAKGDNTQDKEAGYNVKVAANGKKTTTYTAIRHMSTATRTAFYQSRGLHGGKPTRQPFLAEGANRSGARSVCRQGRHDRLLANQGIANR